MRNFFLTLTFLILPAGAVHAGDVETAPADSLELLAGNLDSRELATMLRTLVGPMRVEFPDERTVTVRAPAASLELCRKVRDLLATAAATTRIDTPDGTQILAVRLVRASGAEAMTLVRQTINPAKIAVSAAPPLVVVRDTPEQVDRVLELLQRLEQPGS